MARPEGPPTLPEPLRRRLVSFSSSVFSDSHRAALSDVPRAPPGFPGYRADCEILSSLPLQMSLYFNVYFFPFWWLITVAILYLKVRRKYPALSDYYKFILVTIMILVSLTELIRLYLGYVGNLLEKVPELAGFWLLTLLPQLPIILFLLFNEGLKIHSLERAVHIIFAAFLSFQVVAAFFTLKRMVNTLATRFRLTEFHRLEEQRPAPGPYSLATGSGSRGC
ncbi:transmembrane protein 17 isoform X1 [Vidua chalybeata]|uniref:transmembrane protein 17 isoform X1 n=1 Tax=Vidua chalybeata TaxID=81927 RepID=UPI0023A85399|nr:transmembrane protein 17 isoform X1 [Vidua chalybeata]